MNFTKYRLGVFFLVMVFSIASFAQDKDMMKKDTKGKEMMDNKMMKDDMMQSDMMMDINKNKDGVAINGYDPVSYFTDGKAEMGMLNYSYKWMGANWQFTNEDHLKMFKENPAKYEPQFGGYCTYAACINKMVPADPTVWTMENGKLYLNVNGDAQKLFKKDLDGNIKKAEENWESMHKKNENMMNDKTDMKK
jgi:YHS domain-containing protein